MARVHTILRVYTVWNVRAPCRFTITVARTVLPNRPMPET